MILGLTRWPEEAMLWFNLACYCSLMGRIKEAKSNLAQAIERNEAVRDLVLDDPELKPLWDSIADAR